MSRSLYPPSFMCRFLSRDHDFTQPRTLLTFWRSTSTCSFVSGDSCFVSFAGPEENRDRFEPVLGDDSFLMRPPATKRVANSVEFMGQMVSYPQYIRLMRIQKEVINMDKAKMHLILGLAMMLCVVW